LKKKTSVSLTAEDFTIKNRLGRGAYGDVFLCQKHSDLKHYAMKQIQKKKL
jgi:serine/threonine protein kinase